MATTDTDAIRCIAVIDEFFNCDCSEQRRRMTVRHAKKRWYVTLSVEGFEQVIGADGGDLFVTLAYAVDHMNQLISEQL